MSKLTLFSAKACPFAHRTRLALGEKKLDFELVEIDLQNKPAWFTTVSVYGKVPALEHDGKRFVESAIVKEARRPNAGIVVDTLHFDRCHAELEKLSALPREWFHFAQISDAPASYSTEREELIRIGRAERLYLGEGGIDVASILGRLPQVPLSIEIPNVAKLESLGAEQYARLCIETARSFLAASAYRQAG